MFGGGASSGIHFLNPVWGAPPGHAFHLRRKDPIASGVEHFETADADMRQGAENGIMNAAGLVPKMIDAGPRVILAPLATGDVSSVSLPFDILPVCGCSGCLRASDFFRSGACRLSPIGCLSALCGSLFGPSPLVSFANSFESLGTDALFGLGRLHVGIYRCRDVAIAVLVELLLVHKST